MPERQVLFSALVTTATHRIVRPKYARKMQISICPENRCLVSRPGCRRLDNVATHGKNHEEPERSGIRNIEWTRFGVAMLIEYGQTAF